MSARCLPGNHMAKHSHITLPRLTSFTGSVHPGFHGWLPWVPSLGNGTNNESPVLHSAIHPSKDISEA